MEYFTIKKELFLVPSNDCYEEFKKIDKFMAILKKSGIEKLIEIKINKLGRKGYNPYNLIATILYCFSRFKSSVREIEDLCKFDLRVMYLMEQEIPDYSVISDFINKYILPYTYEIFTMVTQAIIEEFKLDVSNSYFDGSKFEANANKYKFVWKPVKFHKKLDVKIKDLLLQMNFEYKNEELITSFELNEILKRYVVKEHIDVNTIPNGRGKRRTKTQKNYLNCYKYLIKLLEYEEKERKCADSGYGIYDNYKYMRENHINSYVKFASWSGEASGKNPQLFYTFDDGVMCLNTCIGENIPFNNQYHQRNKNGKLYKFTGCNSCNYDYICKKKMKKENRDRDYRIVELNNDYELLKENARQNLLSPEGIELRINRSIQVEGTFGQLKQNMSYERIRRRGIDKVRCEIMLMCLGRNIRKMFTLMDRENIKSNYWKKSKNLKKETFPFPKQKKKKR